VTRLHWKSVVVCCLAAIGYSVPFAPSLATLVHLLCFKDTKMLHS